MPQAALLPSSPALRATHQKIRLRGVSVHNLKNIDLDLPARQLIVLCGVSGSGKSSLAFDTLYAEGQRRYIESFSTYTRGFLPRLERPAVESIEGIRPALAIAQHRASRSTRATVATATDLLDFLRLLWAKLARPFCCGQEVRRYDPSSVAGLLETLPEKTRFLVGFELATVPQDTWATLTELLASEGFVRVVADGKLVDLSSGLPSGPFARELFVVVDRLAVEHPLSPRVLDSLELAFERGAGRVRVLIEAGKLPQEAASGWPAVRRFELDGRSFDQVDFSRRLACEACNRELPEADVRLFNFNHPWGACPRCEGFGRTSDLDDSLIVPDQSLSLRDGAIAPWRTPAYRHELDELLALADDYDVPVDVPVSKLKKRHWDVIRHGVPERQFGGLDGFFRWLDSKKYKTHVRVFAARWRSYRECPECHGERLRPEALAYRLLDRTIAEMCSVTADGAAEWFADPRLTEPLAPPTLRVVRPLLAQIQNRVAFLRQVGLNYLTLDRSMRTLSGGESQRVALTKALGAGLVDTLYVLDEPSIGLHPRDSDRLVAAVRKLVAAGNTVVVVEHEEAFLRAADHLVEIGPEAGHRGGEVVFQGTPEEMIASPTSLTGQYLSGRRGQGTREPRVSKQGHIRLSGATGHNLKDVTVEIPLGVMSVVCGVSGAGKSSLVTGTLAPAVLQSLDLPSEDPLPFAKIEGTKKLRACVLVDQTPISRSPRSNPATYTKSFDEIRKVFAETPESRVRNYAAGHFSFNNEEGRCPQCEGAGRLAIDMQFLPDIYITCPECNGTRYRSEVLTIKHRDRSIADVLDMTIREAFSFFHGRTRIQALLKPLLDVGLEYLRLGQPTDTLSGGEAQRLKLSSHLGAKTAGPTLLILDEPTTGLHPQDISTLLDCLQTLVTVGHTVVVIEHNVQLMRAADWLIELGPGPGEAGGQITAVGTPRALCDNPDSITGPFLTTGPETSLTEEN